MSIQENLDHLRENAPGCQLSAFGDLSTSLILRFSSEARLPRERLDQLCSRATDAFGLLDDVGSDFEENTPQSVMCFTTETSEIYARANVDSADIVCAVLTGAHPIAECAEAATHLAQQLAED